MNAVIEKQTAAGGDAGTTEHGVQVPCVRLILPNSAVSSVIGRGGEVVRVIQR